MDQASMAQMLSQLRAERTELDRRGAALDKAIAGLEELLGESPGRDSRPAPTPAKANSQPRGTEAVRRVLVETGLELSVREINEHLIQRGWTPKSADPLNATSAAAARAAEVLPEIVRRRSDQGAYVYRHQSPTPEPAPDLGIEHNGSSPPQFEGVIAGQG